MIQTLAPEASVGFTKAQGVAVEASWAWLRASEAAVFLPATALALASFLDSGESVVLPKALRDHLTPGDGDLAPATTRYVRGLRLGRVASTPRLRRGESHTT